MYTQNIPIALSYDDVLLVPQYSDIESRSDISLKTYLSPRITLTLPITSAPMADVSGVKMAIALNKSGGLAYLPRFCSIDEEANMVSAVKKAGCQVGAAVGCKDDYLKRAEALVKAKVDALLLDVANGHLQKAVDATKKLKENFGKEVDIHSGLVATKEGLINLFEAGADCVHVGIGGGSICTTRIMTGCGVPNISSIFECAPEARKRNRSIVIDGGIKNSGDIVKACAAGASAVRAGFLLAGFDESPGKLVIINGKKYKSYKGSASLTEKKNHIKKKIINNVNYINHIEGVESVVPYKGILSSHLLKIEAGIKSGFSYSGARDILELWQKAKFVRITPAGLKESGAHDVIVISKD